MSRVRTSLLGLGVVVLIVAFIEVLFVDPGYITRKNDKKTPISAKDKPAKDDKKPEGDMKAEEGKKEEEKKDEAKPADAPKAEEPKAEEPKAEEPKAEEKKDAAAEPAK